MMQQELDLDAASGVTLFGVGGAGGNAVSRLLGRSDLGMKIICANTDMQALRVAPGPNQLQLGRQLTRGLGAGAKPEIGRAAAQEALPEIVAALKGSALCFVAAGLGGGTGTGAAPVIARAARELGILTIGIATRPFAFEGARRARTAAAGLVEFQESVDALVVVCNEHLFRVAGRDTTFRSALDLSDSIVCETAADYAALIAGAALKRVTVADIRTTLRGGGRTVIGYGDRCSGKDRAVRAAKSALRNPLLDDAPRGAERLLVTIAGGPDLSLFEVEEAVGCLREQVQIGADLVWGSVIDPALEGGMRIGIAATCLPPRAAGVAPVAAARSMAKPAGKVSVPIAAPAPVDAQPVRVNAVVPQLANSLVAEAAAQGPSPLAMSEAVEASVAGVAPVPDRDVLVLTNSYSLDLDIVADRPVAKGPVRSRGASASLVDRIYFATRDLKRSWSRAPKHAERQAPHSVRIARGEPRLAMG